MVKIRKHLSFANVAASAALVIAIGISPAGAHVSERVQHLWGEHIKPRLSEPGTPNRSTNPVHWTRLKGVPNSLLDGDDISGALFEQKFSSSAVSTDSAAPTMLAEVTDIPAGTYAIHGKFDGSGQGVECTLKVREGASVVDLDHVFISCGCTYTTSWSGPLQVMRTLQSTGSARIECSVSGATQPTIIGHSAITVLSVAT